MDSSRRKGWVANLIPHEYVHSWCGKFRRPAGMCTPDFQTPLKTRLLWIYEGLAEYLGEVLMVSAGLSRARRKTEKPSARRSPISCTMRAGGGGRSTTQQWLRKCSGGTARIGTT